MSSDRLGILRIAGIVLLVILLAAGVWFYYRFDPRTHFFPRCLFHSLTGWYCPGCGSQRAIHALLHLDLAEAFRRNALLLLALPYVAVGLAFEYGGLKKKWPSCYNKLFGRAMVVFWGAAIILFTLLRNLLGF